MSYRKWWISHCYVSLPECTPNTMETPRKNKAFFLKRTYENHHWFPLILAFFGALNFFGELALGWVSLDSHESKLPSSTPKNIRKLRATPPPFIKMVPEKPVISSKNSYKFITPPSWWLNQPIWKICSSNWIIPPGRDENKMKPPPSHLNNRVQTSITLIYKAVFFGAP